MTTESPGGGGEGGVPIRGGGEGGVPIIINLSSIIELIISMFSTSEYISEIEKFHGFQQILLASHYIIFLD